jgi:hypothetical protein
VTFADDGGGDAEDIRARGVGEACGESLRCRDGLTCKDALCAPSRSLGEGVACTISAECKDGLYCSPLRTCAPGGRRVAGDSCGSEVECGSTLRCNAVGLSAECQPEGAADLGAACKTANNCFAGLLCIAGKCAAPPSTTGAPPVAVSSFEGVACADDPGPVRAYFRVPRGTDDGDFFRLPFPNDVRRKGGKVDLSGFPTPGSDVLGYDLVDRWARYVEATATGFSAYPTITMRFSSTPDFATLKLPGVLRMVDLTVGGANADIGFGWGGTSTRSKYVCPNAINARPAPGLPLKAGHTYALFITNGAKASTGASVEAAADLKAVLGAANPGAPLADAWTAYAPLRAWATSQSLDVATLVNATVFTVGKHTDIATKMATAVAAAPLPSAVGWVKCGAGPSPCAQADGARACGAADPAFDELHALVTLPTWQQGTAPYRTPDEGGDVLLDGNGTPTVQGSSQVCMSLTIPKNAAMPAGGWPLAIYAHATGGSFRSHVVDGVAKRFATADGSAASIAVLGFDQVSHGTRRGAGSMARPEALWFATANPRALRGNALQAAADLLALSRMAPAFALSAAMSPTAADIKFGSVVLVGHGQGANAVALADPHAPAYVKGVVLGGIGASFVDTVPSKKNPVDFASVAPAILGEITVSNTHPVLGMFQNALDPVDPIDHASLLVSAPPTEARHAFAVYGKNDSYTPGPTQLAYTFAAALGVAAPPVSVGSPDNIGEPTLAVPAGGNVATDITAIVRQYDRNNYDGHFVMLMSDEAKTDVDRFVADVLLAKIPMIGR